MNQTQLEHKKTSPFGYSLGMLGLSIPSQAFTVYLMYYYVETLNLAVGLAAIGRTIFSIWDAVDNPIFGYLSDNTRTKYGRRRPWMLITLPFYLVFFILMFSVPDYFKSGNNLFIYFTVILLIYETAATILWGNYGALFPELFKGRKVRARTSAFKQAFAIVGMIIGIALTPMVYTNFGFTGMAVLYGILGCILTIISIFLSHEDPNIMKQPRMGFLEAYKITLKNKPFWIYSIAYTFAQFVFGLLTAGIPFYAKYTLHLDSGKTTFLMASVFLVAIPMVAVWAKLLGKWGARKTWLCGMGALALSVIPLGLANNLTTGIIAGMILGIGYSGVLVSGEVVTSEIIDQDAERTGIRREAVYLSVYGFIIRFSGVLQSLAFALIGLLFGYVSGSNPGPNPDKAFRFLMCVIPFVGVGIGWLIGLKFKLKEDNH